MLYTEEFVIQCLMNEREEDDDTTYTKQDRHSVVYRGLLVVPFQDDSSFTYRGWATVMGDHRVLCDESLEDVLNEVDLFWEGDGA